jgi:hypothetical protein
LLAVTHFALVTADTGTQERAADQKSKAVKAPRPQNSHAPVKRKVSALPVLEFARIRSASGILANSFAFDQTEKLDCNLLIAAMARSGQGMANLPWV